MKVGNLIKSIDDFAYEREGFGLIIELVSATAWSTKCWRVYFSKTNNYLFKTEDQIEVM